MSAFQRLLQIIRFCKENSNERTALIMQSFEEQFISNNSLSPKQFQALRSIVRQVNLNLSESEAFERELGRFLKSSEAKSVFRLVG